MRTVTQNYKNYIASSLVRKPKSKVVIDGVTYTGEEHLVSYPKFGHHSEKATGSFPAATCEFEIYNRDGSLTLNGKEVTVYRGLEINGTVEWVQIGVFAAKDEDIKTNINKRTISFKGTDKTRLFDNVYGGKEQWESGSKVVLDIVNEICARIGVPSYSPSFRLCNYEFTDIPPGVDFDTITDRQIISAIAELAGCIAVITPNGKLRFKYETINTVKISKNKYKSLSVENAFGPINTVSFGYADYDDATVKKQDGVTEDTKIEWAINDNPLATTEDKVNLLDRVSDNYFGRSFIPFELVDFIDDFIYELNDKVTIEKKDGSTFSSTILDVSSISRIKSNLKSPLQTPGKSNTPLAGGVGNIKREVEKVKLTVNHQEHIINLHAERLEHIENAGYISTSDFEQKVDSLKLEVKGEIKDLEESTAAKLQLYVEKDDNNQIVSMLNASADEININSDRLIINSTNFKLAKDGTVTATNAKLTDGVIDISNDEIGVLIKNGAIIQSGFQFSAVNISFSPGGMFPTIKNIDTEIEKTSYGGLSQVYDFYDDSEEDEDSNWVIDWYEVLFYDQKYRSKGIVLARRNDCDEKNVDKLESYSQFAVFTDEKTSFNSDEVDVTGVLKTLKPIQHLKPFKFTYATFGCGDVNQKSTANLSVNSLLTSDSLAVFDLYRADQNYNDSGRTITIKDAAIVMWGANKGVSAKMIFDNESKVIFAQQGGDYKYLDVYGKDIYSNGIKISSTETVKTNISSAPSALDLFNPDKSNIYSYNYIKQSVPSEPEQSAESSDGFSFDGFQVDIEPEKETCYGFVIGEGYATPSEVLSEDGKHINLYSMAAINWKATQELLEKITALESEIVLLKSKGA